MILALLAEADRELTAVQIQAALPDGINLRTLCYHLKVLVDCRLVVEDGGSYRHA